MYRQSKIQDILTNESFLSHTQHSTFPYIIILNNENHWKYMEENGKHFQNKDFFIPTLISFTFSTKSWALRCDCWQDDDDVIAGGAVVVFPLLLFRLPLLIPRFYSHHMKAETPAASFRHLNLWNAEGNVLKGHGIGTSPTYPRKHWQSSEC